MTLPKSFRLFGKTWRVEKASLEESGNCCGYEALVQIDPTDTSLEQVHVTILHEVIHAIESDLCLEMSERLTSRLSVGLYSWMKDNPKIIEWMMKE